jgi:glycosyltransferase involved in cell wall biosynthesis
VKNHLGGVPATLSLITITKDDPKGLLLTLSSIRNQENIKNIALEHIVIDGSVGAQESLTEIPDRYMFLHIRQKGIGLYSAQNEGIRQASGTYVHFLNSGDILANPGTLFKLVNLLQSVKPVWAFAPLQTRLPGDLIKTRVHSFNYFREKQRNFSNGRFPTQPNIAYDRNTLISLGGFDESLSYSADFEVMFRLSQLAKPLFLDFPLVDFELGGITSRNYARSVLETRKVILRSAKPIGLRRLAMELNLGLWLFRSALSQRRRDSTHHKI